MELERRRRRRRNDRKEAMEDRSIHDLPDDLLRRIFLRLDSPLWLGRAACACKRWRRAVTDEGRAFLRLASSLHPPIVVGQYRTRERGDYRFVPSPSSPIVDSSRFFVAEFHDGEASVADCHGGLVLFSLSCPVSDPNLLVYDPMTRKRRWMPRLRPPKNSKQVFRYAITDGVFLLDGDDGHISLSNFRLLYRLYPVTSGYPKACVFSTANGGELDWLFSIDDVNTMELMTYRQNRNNVFDYTLPWRLLRPYPY